MCRWSRPATNGRGRTRCSATLEPAASCCPACACQLRSFRGFVGINNHMGSLLTADRGQMALVMAELRRARPAVPGFAHHLEVGRRHARRSGIGRAACRARRVPRQRSRPRLRCVASSTATERIARRRGLAVAIGHPHDVTIEALRSWLPTLEERGFALVPISAVVARASCASGLLVAASACGRYVSAQNAVQ